MIAPSYHDLHVTTEDMERTSLFNLPYNVEVTCTRTGGWQVWHQRRDGARVVLAAEYGGDGQGLRLDVAGIVIVDSMPFEDCA
ncbi:hypothetical protein GURKE_00820 [Brevundimonas phage vB_BpoS-Gurke]|uniref:Uncharacterized protein n=1 Tax=Brevundimonas phage vB_BpoS-Gurke TaxID=2948599 RepID=A0A9E7SQG9_9CAUD|nr:hypothetical protein GURKE_00820 [Brevundimonas phage vB_BpoS-Gurke]